MHRLAIAGGVFALALAAGPAAAQCLPASAGNSEGNYIVPGVRGDIVYRRANGVPLALDAYVQQRGSRRPAIIIVHGGGWDTGSRVSFTGQFQELLTRAGYNWFAIDYRLNGLAQYREAVDDLRAAVEFVRCGARDFQIDPENIALLGEDAGAQLALLLAADAPVGVKAVVSIGGFYDLSQPASLKSRYGADLLASASPSGQRLAAMPPVLVIHGGADTEAPPRDATSFCDALKTARRSCTAIVVDAAIHRPENWTPAQWGYKSALTEWLATTMRLAAADFQPYVSRLTKDIVFSPAQGLKLDAYAPDGPGPFPAVIVAHGGGWEAGDKVTYVTPLFEPLAKAGFAYFSIDYRLTPQFHNADQLDDLREAVRFVRANAARFRIDPNRVAILGESASGQLVAQLAAERMPGVAAAVSFYGVYDFLQMTPASGPRSIAERLFGLTGTNDAAKEAMKALSPIFRVQPGMPPLLLIQGTADRLHAQAVAFGDRLKEVGAAYDSYDVAGAPHGVENWEGHSDWMPYKARLVEWLKKTLASRSR